MNAGETVQTKTNGKIPKNVMKTGEKCGERKKAVWDIKQINFNDYLRHSNSILPDRFLVLTDR